MTEDDPVRRAAQYRVDREIAREAAEQGAPDRAASPDGPSGAPSDGPEASAAAERPRLPVENRGQWVDELVRQAMARGEFDDLPLTGKPIPGLGARHDPDWWLKSLVEREQITGVLPSAQLRAEDAGLREQLDRQFSEESVREILAEFNARVIDARRQLLGGPPVVTPLRDVEEEVAAWRDRRSSRGSPGPTTARASSDRSRGRGSGGRGSRTDGSPGEGPGDGPGGSGDGSGEPGARRWWRRRRPPQAPGPT
jgi:hypothetical protein